LNYYTNDIVLVNVNFIELHKKSHIQYLHSHSVDVDEWLFTVAFKVRVVGNGHNDGFCFVGDHLNFVPDIGNAYGEYSFSALSSEAANASMYKQFHEVSSF
jgi:hypothetical protein